MELTLEEIVVLANTPKTTEKANKFDISFATTNMLQNMKVDWNVASALIDGLVSKGYINRQNNSFYTLTNSGKKALKDSYDALQLMLLSVYTKLTP